MAVVHKYLRLKKKFPHVWCAGCTNGIILHATIRAIDKLKIPKDDVLMVSGIGCSSRAPVYFDFNTLHTTHGRAIPFATGAKLVKPHLKVIVITGDGDALAIGGNHFIHACVRNIDLTVIVFNNFNYGMTGGQRSPTTPPGKRTTTSPFGSIDPPVNVCSLAMGAGATFVARTTAYHFRPMESIIARAIQHKGFSVVEVRCNCPIIYGRLNRLGDGAKMLLDLKEQSMTVEAWKKLPPEKQKKAEQEKIIIGVLKEDTKTPEYTEQYRALCEQLQAL
ncbi:2-oxoacid:ferredoxin oxidoreductase subunit beta [Candidatus Sumerlaeota bacterium]|nr:2-oxoacid:ferredoxin oxidoreductase subunit beta [Candidatus Sumerlaeota bacterium]